MELIPLCDLELRYTHLTALDFGADGQIFGTMEGSVRGPKIRGTLQVTNLAPRRADNVNLPRLRGLLHTDDGATIYVTMDGIATLRPEDDARIFTTSLTFRTGDDRYRWLNTVFALVEGVLDTVAQGGVARAHAYQCRPTIDL